MAILALPFLPELGAAASAAWAWTVANAGWIAVGTVAAGAGTVAVKKVLDQSNAEDAAPSTVCQECTKGMRCMVCSPVPVGGTAYDYHSAAAGNDPHYDKKSGIDMPDHTHHFLMQQSPPAAGCRCFWKRDYIEPTPGFSPLPGEVPVVPAGGGGIAP